MDTMSLSVLDQQDTWTDREGVQHRIADMEPRYCRNVYGFLMRQADALAGAYGWYLCSTPMPDADTAAFDHVMDAFDHEMDQMRAHPEAWLSGKPLLRALRARFNTDVADYSQAFQHAVATARLSLPTMKATRIEQYWTGFTIVCNRDGSYAVYDSDAWTPPRSQPMLPWSPPQGEPVADVDVDGNLTLRGSGEEL